MTQLYRVAHHESMIEIDDVLVAVSQLGQGTVIGHQQSAKCRASSNTRASAACERWPTYRLQAIRSQRGQDFGRNMSLWRQEKNAIANRIVCCGQAESLRENKRSKETTSR